MGPKGERGDSGPPGYAPKVRFNIFSFRCKDQKMYGGKRGPVKKWTHMLIQLGSKLEPDAAFRDRKENPASSWGLMGDLCTSVAWRDFR